MSHHFLELLDTPGVREARAENGSLGLWETEEGDRTDTSEALRARERSFVQARNSFYLATTNANGWPYVQHRGGSPGFVKVVDAHTLAFADLRGNRQYVTTGNVKTDDRAALLFMDYPNRRRLKILGHLKAIALDDDPELAAQVVAPGDEELVERIFVLTVEAFDWNCPQHITPRYTREEIEVAAAPLRQRLTELEAEVASLRRELGKR